MKLRHYRLFNSLLGLLLFSERAGPVPLSELDFASPPLPGFATDSAAGRGYGCPPPACPPPRVLAGRLSIATTGPCSRPHSASSRWSPVPQRVDRGSPRRRRHPEIDVLPGSVACTNPSLRLGGCLLVRLQHLYRGPEVGVQSAHRPRQVVAQRPPGIGHP